MTPQCKDTIATFAILFATWTLAFTGWYWWERRSLDWLERPWYAMFPPATALAAMAIGAAVGWLWTRSTNR